MSFIPGQNLLTMALTMITRQAVTYYKAVGRELNSLGQWVTMYADGITIYGSWQPVPREILRQFGLDFQKDYYTLYAPENVFDIDRDITSDQIAFNGQLFQVESDNDWFALDGWKGILCIHIGSDNQQGDLFGFGQIPAINSYLNFSYGNFLGSDEN
jgi:hypothetical protein